MFNEMIKLTRCLLRQWVLVCN